MDLHLAHVSLGAMVLAHSLRDNGTKKRLAILVTMEDIEVATIEELKVRSCVYTTGLHNDSFL